MSKIKCIPKKFKEIYAKSDIERSSTKKKWKPLNYKKLRRQVEQQQIKIQALIDSVNFSSR